MASRLMHLAVADEILKKENIEDIGRFRLGCILPDARIDSALRDAPHFQTYLPDGMVTCSLKSFLEHFGAKMAEDDLYLGYYMHLIQDMVYRRYMYLLPDWDARIPENIRKLHSDYRKINRYIIDGRALENGISAPPDFENEAINQMFGFDIEAFLEELDMDFRIVREGSCEVFTPKMAEDFFALATQACLHELRSLREGLPLCDETKMCWGKE